MSTICDISNTPVEYKIGDRKFKIQRLSILELFSVFEKEIKNEYLDTVKNLSSVLSGKDKMDYLMLALKDLPTGQVLQKEIQTRMSSLKGGVQCLFIALKKNQPDITFEEVEALSNDKNSTDISLIINYIMSSDTKDESKEPPIVEPKNV